MIDEEIVAVMIEVLNFSREEICIRKQNTEENSFEVSYALRFISTQAKS